MRHAALLILIATSSLSRAAGAGDMPPPALTPPAAERATANPGPAGQSTAEAPGAPAALPTPPAEPAGCIPDGSGFLRARLRGDLEADIDWQGDDLECRGMPRPDGQGLRMRFAGVLADGTRLALLFAAPTLAEGANARAVPVNVTLLLEGTARFYGTRGEGRCLLDRVEQQPLDGAGIPPHSWRVTALGFCTDPAREVGGGGALLMTRFDFAGRVTFAEDEPPPAEPAP